MSETVTVTITTSDIQSIRDKSLRNKVQFRYDTFVHASAEYESALHKMLDAGHELKNAFVGAFAERGHTVDPAGFDNLSLDENNSVICTYNKPDDLA